VFGYRKKLDVFYASHLFWGALVLGGFWGLFGWVGFGLWNHALNLFAFELWMGGGLLFGPIVVILARRKQSRGPDSN
jgi:hypothetical protein